MPDGRNKGVYQQEDFYRMSSIPNLGPDSGASSPDTEMEGVLQSGDMAQRQRGIGEIPPRPGNPVADQLNEQEVQDSQDRDRKLNDIVSALGGPAPGAHLPTSPGEGSVTAAPGRRDDTAFRLEGSELDKFQGTGRYAGLSTMPESGQGWSESRFKKVVNRLTPSFVTKRELLRRAKASRENMKAQGMQIGQGFIAAMPPRPETLGTPNQPSTSAPAGPSALPQANRKALPQADGSSLRLFP